jgi:biopolymer transport protein ExbD
MISIDDLIVKVDQISNLMALKLEQNPLMIVAFKTDTYTQYGVVSDVMEQLKEVNATRVFFNNDIESIPGLKY